LHAQLVQNGSFEQILIPGPPWATSTLDGWLVGEILGTGGPNQNKVDGLDTSFQYALGPHTGDIAAAFNSTTNTVTTGGVATLTQTLTTDPSKTYDLSLWVANPIEDSSNFNNIFSVSWNGTLVTLSGPYVTEVGLTKTYLITPETDWFQLVIPGLSVTGTATALVISGRNSDWATLVDDVVVLEIPEPVTLILLGIGALLVAFYRSRRNWMT
jgi:hypothetical protein